MRENDSNERSCFELWRSSFIRGRIPPIISNERDLDAKKIGEISHMADELLVTLRFL